MTSRKPEWQTNPDLPVGKGATLQQWIATVGESKFEMDVAPWGEGHLKVNAGRSAKSRTPRTGGRFFASSTGWRSFTCRASRRRLKARGKLP
jgi:enoyl-[acyl-carrier protein] reductase I